MNMPGSATLDPNVLIDDLVPTIDDLRDDLHAQFGDRAYRVFVVTRQWSGSMVGDGEFVDTEVEILPCPYVVLYYALEYKSIRYKQEPCGLKEAGFCEIREVSLSYTFSELGAGEADNMAQQRLIKITERYGQEQPTRYFVHAQTPYTDRVKDMGWQMYLAVLTE